MEEEGVDKSEEVYGKGLLPPPFAITDLLVVFIRKSRTNSLQAFIENISEKVDPEETPPEYLRLLDLKQKYEAFCFINRYSELCIRENKMLFKSYGIEFTIQSDSSTEVFKKLRMLTIREIRE